MTQYPRALAALFALAAGCGTRPVLVPRGDAEPPADARDASDGDAADAPSGPVRVLMDFTRASGFFTAPFPSEERRAAPGGGVDLAGFPAPASVPYAQTLLALARDDVDGFGATSAVYFALSGPIDAAQLAADPARSLASDAPVFLVGVDRAGRDFGVRRPVTVSFQDDAGPFGARNLLALLPVQGVPLRPHETYAAVVLRALRDRAGAPLEVPPSMAALAAGMRPAGLTDAAFEAYRAALAALGEMGVPASAIAGLAVFRTQDPTATFAAFLADARARVAPPLAPFARTDVFENYCVYASRVAMPVYQQGTPPYDTAGGNWTREPDGARAPRLARQETARVVVTVPRRAMPSAAGFPVAVFIRTGGGGDRPLVDRGTHAVAGGPAIEPGSGPAREFARAGWAGASADGPHGGLRNVTMGDEQFLVFNVANPVAMRDNVRQSALETALLLDVLAGVTVDARDCPGVSTPDGTGVVRFDVAAHAAVMGHSMGATIAPLAVAFEPRYRAMLLSGAGGSWIANVMYKQRPTPVRPVAEVLLRYSAMSRRLREDDPMLNVLQWGAESADPPVYARYVVHEPPGSGAAGARHVLMMQGIVDHYILPPIANATSLSLGLDLGGEALDARTPELAPFAPLATLLGLVGRAPRALPVQGNVVLEGGAGARTAVVVQFPSDAIEDGHEAVFQTAPPRRAYACFLESLARGGGGGGARAPVVTTAGEPGQPCP